MRRIAKDEAGDGLPEPPGARLREWAADHDARADARRERLGVDVPEAARLVPWSSAAVRLSARGAVAACEAAFALGNGDLGRWREFAEQLREINRELGSNSSMGMGPPRTRR